MSGRLHNSLINSGQSVREALSKINSQPETRTLFVMEANGKLLGSITDGDIRRGLLNGLTLDTKVDQVMNRNFRFLTEGNTDTRLVKDLKLKGIMLVPVLDDKGHVSQIVDLTKKRTLLPLDAVIMAGGRGERLSPLTIDTPKPLLKVGDKPIIDHNLDRLSEFGLQNFFVSINYLGDKIEKHLGARFPGIRFIKENQPLGTVGSVSLIDKWQNEIVLIMNCDLLTNIDFEDFYNSFIEEGADMMVASIPFKVQIPYAVLDTEEKAIRAFEEKPSYTYYTSAGIYLVKRELLSRIPKDTIYNATDLLQDLIDRKLKVKHYPILGYWLDIGKHEDYRKAQEDIRHIRF